jgi:hypothetical protein
MDAEATVLAYYEALRAGEPLSPFFAAEETSVKFGIGERLTGHEAIRAGLSRQTATTDDWQIDSDRLVVTERSEHAWFSDDVFMAWTDTEAEVRYEFETRWSGTLERRPAEPWAGSGQSTPWRFVGMHVSTPGGTR